MGLGNMDCKEVRSHQEIIEYAFKRVGRDPNRFHAYRYRAIYPVPLVSFTWWSPPRRSHRVRPRSGSDAQAIRQWAAFPPIPEGT